MASILCKECKQRPAGLRKNGNFINVRGFDLCSKCNKSLQDALWRKPRFTRRKDIPLLLLPEDQYKKQQTAVWGGAEPSTVNPNFHRRSKLIFT
jgi:hypothetical protein